VRRVVASPRSRDTRPRVAFAVLLAAGVMANALGAACAAHAADAPIVRVTLDAPQPVLVGQQVRLDVLVLVPNFFTAAPRFPQIDAPGATVALLDDALNANDTIDGTSYAGVQRTYVITALQPGEVTVPAARIGFSYAAEPGKPGVAGSVEIPAQRIVATASVASSPDGATTAGASLPDLAAEVPVAQVGVEQSLDRPIDGLKVGDTVTRTITTSARDAAATSIPPPSFAAPDGVRVYVHDPVLTDLGVRDGGPGGRRVDRVTYAFEQPGRYTLPAIEVAWLDPADRQRKTSRAPEIVVEVAANPAAAPAIIPEATTAGAAHGDGSRAAAALRRVLPWALVAAALVLVAGWAWRRWAHVVRARLGARRAAQASSEEVFFARLDAACRADDPEAAYHALGAWARRAGWPSLAAACASHAGLAAATSELEAQLYGRRAATGSWRGMAVREAAAGAREAALARHERVHGVALRALNP